MYIVGLNQTQVWTSSETPEFVENQIGFNSDGKAYQFVNATAAIAVGDVCTIDENGDSAGVTTTTSAPAAGQGLPVGVAVAAIASGGFGWLQRQGVIGAINVATSAAVHTNLNSTATAGRIDDDASTGAELIEGVTTTGAESSNSATGILNWPYVGATL